VLQKDDTPIRICPECAVSPFIFGDGFFTRLKFLFSKQNSRPVYLGIEERFPTVFGDDSATGAEKEEVDERPAEL